MIRSTYAHREAAAKVLLKKLITAEERRWSARSQQILRARPTVAARIEASLVDDAQLELAQARTWLDAATIPRRIR